MTQAYPGDGRADAGLTDAFRFRSVVANSRSKDLRRQREDPRAHSSLTLLLLCGNDSLGEINPDEPFQ